MSENLLHPRDEIVQMMQRIYRYGMTTTSGGNLSIRDDDGSIWITPGGVDKGNLTRDDIVNVRTDGTVTGPHAPSVEFPFHKAVYAVRPEFKAVVHAHPAALVTYSIARTIPDTRIIPQANHICGTVGYAPYAMPGTTDLGSNIARAFADRHDIVIMANHGAVAGGLSLQQAFERFETLDFCARLAIKAGLLGKPVSLTDEQIRITGHDRHLLPEFVPETHTSQEKDLRARMSGIVRRAYQQQLMTSTEGTVSARVDTDSFLVTPYGIDRQHINPADMVLIRSGRREKGKVPSRSVNLHSAVYRKHPAINSLILAQPPNIMAFAISNTPFDSKSIPESYVVLRCVPRLPYGVTYTNENLLVETVGAATPVVIIESETLVTSGTSILQAYDRLEVAEFTAKALINTRAIGGFAPMEDEKIEALEKAFF